MIIEVSTQIQYRDGRPTTGYSVHEFFGTLQQARTHAKKLARDIERQGYTGARAYISEGTKDLGRVTAY